MPCAANFTYKRACANINYHKRAPLMLNLMFDLLHRPHYTSLTTCVFALKARRAKISNSPTDGY